MTNMDCNKTGNRWQESVAQQKDFMAEMMRKCLQEVMERQFNEFICAKEYERTNARKGLRNGYYDRQLNTRVGSITLHVCRDRKGKFKTDLFDKYQRSEKALVCTIAEMYFSGVSTRKVKAIVKELCGTNVSKSQVSELVKSLDDELTKWKNRPLLEEYVYLLFDARYEKVRENGYIVSKAFVTVIGITSNGIREVIGYKVINSESYEGWDNFLKSLKDRGLHGVVYAVSDENKGLRKALYKHFQGVHLQRCQVHFMRNFVDKLAKNEKEEAVKLLQDVFAAETKEGHGSKQGYKL